jgi:hypothetical protein
MNDYSMVCGAAFEDLTHDEMMDFDGGATWTPTPFLTATSIPCAAGFSVSVIVVSVITYVRK